MKSRIPPKKYFEFNSHDRERTKKTFEKTWGDFRESLAKNEFSYDQTDKALESIFLKQFDQLFLMCGKTLLSVSLKDVFATYNIGRGTKLEINEETPCSRFIPIAKYIHKDNRFSPPGVEWLYLAIGDTDAHIKGCAEAECGVKKGNRFGFCKFSLVSIYGNSAIVDLTKFANDSYDNINNGLTMTAETVEKKALVDVFSSGYGSRANIKISTSKYECELKEAILLWTLKIYSTMLSELIFIPVEDDQKHIEYSPFQTLAKYFEKQGFGGIIYKSTKYDYAKNLVLFNKNYANPIAETIHTYII